MTGGSRPSVAEDSKDDVYGAQLRGSSRNQSINRFVPVRDVQFENSERLGMWSMSPDHGAALEGVKRFVGLLTAGVGLAEGQAGKSGDYRREP